MNLFWKLVGGAIAICLIAAGILIALWVPAALSQTSGCMRCGGDGQQKPPPRMSIFYTIVHPPRAAPIINGRDAAVPLEECLALVKKFLSETSIPSNGAIQAGCLIVSEGTPA